MIANDDCLWCFQKGKYKSKTPSTQTKRSRLKSDHSGKSTSNSGSSNLGGSKSYIEGPPQFNSLTKTEQQIVRQLSEEQEMTMDMHSEVSDSGRMSYDCNSSGYGSSITSPSEMTHSTFFSDNPATSNGHTYLNKNNSCGAQDKEDNKDRGKPVKKEPLVKVLSSTSC